MVKIVVFIVFYSITLGQAQKWTFSVMADHLKRSEVLRDNLVELRDMNVNTNPPFPNAEFIVGCGDLDLSEIATDRGETKSMWQIWNEPQYNSIPYYPAMGNHDEETPGDVDLVLNTILPSHDSIIIRNDNQCNYHIDWNNIRFIVFNNTIGGYGLPVNYIGWVDSLIREADFAQHVFIAFHRPAFPRYRHASSSGFGGRDEFWDMLVSHDNKVKAVFVGHTHAYYRMRVLDPRSICANDASSPCLPDDEGGIYQVDAASGSHLIFIQVDGEALSFMVKKRVGTSSYEIIDTWEIRPDSLPPYFKSLEPYGTVHAPSGEVTLKAITNKNSFLRWSLMDQDYYSMENQFASGEGTKIHSTPVAGEHGKSYTYYLKAIDNAGHAMDTSALVSYTVDTTPPKVFTLVDFGASESSTTFGVSGWNRAIIDRYTDYTGAGPGGTGRPSTCTGTIIQAPPLPSYLKSASLIPTVSAVTNRAHGTI
jgi:hypothetical protein